MQCEHDPFFHKLKPFYLFIDYTNTFIYIYVNERTKLHFRADNFTTNKDISTAESVRNAP